MRPTEALRVLCAPLMAMLVVAAAQAADAPSWRHTAPVTVLQAAPYVQLPLPPAAYAHSLQPDLADLRIVDADGARVPHAVLPPREPAAGAPALRPVAVYALPPRTAPGATLGMPVEVEVQGERITVRQRPGTAGPAAGSTVPGWLLDLGERRAGQPVPQAVRLQWAGTGDFSAAYELQVSDTLRAWQAAGGGQLLSLGGAGAPLVQAEVPLPATAPRFVRLVWAEPATAPRLTSAQAVLPPDAAPATDPPTVLTVAASAPPPGERDTAPGSLHYDLGGVLPVLALALQLPPGTRVAPVRVQGRERAGAPWQELGATVFYRIERDGTAGSPPAWPMQARVRYLRLLPDPRAGAPDPAQAPLAVHVRLATLVFALQGRAPWRLQAGSATAPPGALPVATLVPQLEDERPRLGRAQLGAISEVPEVAQQAADAQRSAALRPWLLWAVLLAGVGGLGAMVWRLARSRPAA